jgi:hypothetical protein
MELARIMSNTARIDGFNIDLSKFPPKEWIPPNISLQIRDCVTPFPEELKGTYDIVYIHLFHLDVHNNDPEPVFKNLLSLLSIKGHPNAPQIPTIS